VTEPEPELAVGELAALLRLLLLLAALFLAVLLLAVFLVAELLPVLAVALPDAAALAAAGADAEPADAACCAPGRANATAPAANRLVTPAAAVTARSRACPRSRSATARLVSSACLLIGGILSDWVTSQSLADAAGPPLLSASEPAMSAGGPRPVTDFGSDCRPQPEWQLDQAPLTGSIGN
jgi:hypothetical protein